MKKRSLKEKQDFIILLKDFVTEERNKRFEEIIAHRTRHITVVLEDIYQPHNASAVLRSCDCFGIQDVHIIENKHTYNVNPQVAMGASKWLNLNKYNSTDDNTLACINKLKKKGYKIVATTPHEKGIDISELEINQKFALLYGTEMHGLTQTALDSADTYVKIPMYGFTESFNISVTVALCLFYLSEKLRHSKIKFGLTAHEKADVLIQWYMNSINAKNKDALISGCR